MVEDHVAQRRARILALVRKIPGLSSTDELVSMGEAHVCRLLLELHQHGPIPEDHFSWLVDQFMARSIEAQRPHLAGRAFAILGPVPSTRADYAVAAASAVWNRYEVQHKNAAAHGLRDRSTSSSSSSSSSSPSAEGATDHPGRAQGGTGP